MLLLGTAALPYSPLCINLFSSRIERGEEDGEGGEKFKEGGAYRDRVGAILSLRRSYAPALPHRPLNFVPLRSLRSHAFETREEGWSVNGGPRNARGVGVRGEEMPRRQKGDGPEGSYGLKLPVRLASHASGPLPPL